MRSTVGIHPKAAENATVHDDVAHGHDADLWRYITGASHIARFRTGSSRDGQVLYMVHRVDDVTKEVAWLRDALPSSARIDCAYADLPDADQRIRNFSQYGADVLVATTVVECGLDIGLLNTVIVQDSVCARG